MKRNQLACALAAVLLAPAAGNVFAQSASSSGSQGQQGATEGNPKQLQAVTVTGSAIPRIDTETPSPMVTISAADIQRSGYTNVSDVIQAVSANNSGSIPTAFTNGFAAGSSAVALRGLTAQATLVLIDGQRAASYAAPDDGTRSFVDLNSIPLVAIERIEVLKDGASAVYGADAVAGVVNIILKPSYKGVQLTANLGDSQHGGGFTKQGSILGGFGDLQKDGYNAYFGAEVQDTQAIEAKSRPFPFNTGNLSRIGGINPDSPAHNTGSIVGSATPATLSSGGALSLLNGVPVQGAPTVPLGACGPGGSVLVNNNPDVNGSYCQQDLSHQYGQVQPATKQIGLYGRVTVKLNDTTKAYFSASYDEFKTYTVSNPAQIQNGSQLNTNAIVLPWQLPNGQLNPNNPFAAQHQYAQINYAFGNIPRGTDYDNHNFRVVGDLAGTLGEWNYDVTAVANRTWLNSDQFGYLSGPQLYSAVANGSYNFVNPSANSQAQLRQLAPGYKYTATTDLDSLNFTANRELFDLPGGPLAVAVGAAWRHEGSSYPEMNPIVTYPNGNNLGTFEGLGLAASQGHRSVSSASFEFDAPLLESLEADVSGRYDYYSDVGNNFSPKLGLKWKPTDWLAVRGTYSRGFIAPSFAQNNAKSINEGFVTQVTPQSFQAAHGNDAYSQPYTLAVITQGNPKLKPEKSSSFTLGTVVQPTDWFSASVDYYHIKIDDAFTQADYTPAVNAYFAGQPVPAGFTVTPDQPDPQNPSASLRPLTVSTQFVNASWIETSGVDFDFEGHFKFSNGIEWISSLQPTEIFYWRQKLGGQVQSFVGTQGPYQLSSGAGTPRWRGTWTNTLIYGPWTASLIMDYTSGYSMIAEDAGVFPDSGLCLSQNAAGGAFPASCRSGSFTVFNLTGSYQVNDKVTVTGSIMNLFDKLPPFDPADYAGGSLNYNPTYAQSGLVGRFFNLGVKVKL